MAKKRGHFRLMLLCSYLLAAEWIHPIFVSKKEKGLWPIDKGGKKSIIYLFRLFTLDVICFFPMGCGGVEPLDFLANSLVGEQQVYFQATKQSHWFFFFCCRWRSSSGIAGIFSTGAQWIDLPLRAAAIQEELDYSGPEGKADITFLR